MADPISDELLDLIRGRRPPPPPPPPPPPAAPPPQTDFPRIEDLTPQRRETGGVFGLRIPQFDPFVESLAGGIRGAIENIGDFAFPETRRRLDNIIDRMGFDPDQLRANPDTLSGTFQTPSGLTFTKRTGEEILEIAERELRRESAPQGPAEIAGSVLAGLATFGAGEEGRSAEELRRATGLESIANALVGGTIPAIGAGVAPLAGPLFGRTAQTVRGAIPQRSVPFADVARRDIGEFAATERAIGARPVERASARAAPTVREATQAAPEPTTTAVTGPPRPVEQLALGAPAERLALAAPEVPTPTTAVERAAIPLTREVPVGRKALPQPSTPTAPSTPAGLMAPGDAEETVKWFGALLTSPDTARAMELTTELRAHALGRRFAAFQTRAKQLVDEGVTPEEAIKRARQELQGELPRIQTGVESIITEEVRNALFSRVYTVLVNDVPEQLATVTALTNALLGKPIPRVPGIAGKSAFSRLSRIFPPEIMEVLGKKQSLDELLLSKFPPPRGVAGVDIAPSVPFGQARLGEEAVPLRLLPPDLRSATQRDLELLDFRASLAGRARGVSESADFAPAGALDAPQQARMFDAPFLDRQLPLDPRTGVQLQLDLEAFKTLLAEAPRPPLRGDLFPPGSLDEAVQANLKLLNPTARERIIATGNFLGMQAMDAGLLLRANVASFDLSYPRQMALFIPRHPVAFSQSFYDSLRTVWSREFGENVMGAIQRDPLYSLYAKLQVKEGRDFLRPLTAEVAGRWQAMEEAMILARVTGETMPRPFQRIAQMTPWIRISARAHIIGINSMTWKIFQGYHKQLLKKSEQIASGAIKLKPGQSFSIEKELDIAAQWLAEGSGRGPLGPLKALSPASNALFFSLRLNIGRALVLRHLFSSSPFVRRRAWETVITGVTTIGGFIMAGRQMGLWDVETDRRSSDFMKIIIAGRARIDPWGGFQQFAVLYGRLLSVFSAGESQVKSAETGVVTGVGPLDLGGRFLRTKLSPAASAALEAWEGKDFKGSDIDRTDWKRWLGRNAPIAGQDIYEAFEAFGLIGIPLGALGAFGVGEQVFDLPRWPELDEYYKFSEGRSQQHANTLRKRFRQDPDNEAKLFLRGQITTLSTDAARRRVLELMREFKVDPADVPGFENVFGGQRPAGVSR